MKVLKWILIIVVSVFILFISAALIFRLTFSPKNMKAFSINAPSSKTKILLATQDTKFKEQVLKQLEQDYQNKPVFFQIIDVKDISTFDPGNWHKILIFNAIESDKISETGENFVNQYSNTNKIILIATSGSGKWEKNNLNIDTLTVASKQENLNKVISYIEKHIDPIINTE